MKQETVRYLAALELRLRACETKIDLLRGEIMIGEEARQTECVHSPEIRADGMLVCGCGVELGHIDNTDYVEFVNTVADQEKQLAASPYLVEEVEPEELPQGVWADLDPDLGKPAK